MIRVEVEHFPSRNRLCVDVDENLVTDELRALIDGLIGAAAQLLAWTVTQAAHEAHTVHSTATRGDS